MIYEPIYGKYVPQWGIECSPHLLAIWIRILVSVLQLSLETPGHRPLNTKSTPTPPVSNLHRPSYSAHLPRPADNPRQPLSSVQPSIHSPAPRHTVCSWAWPRLPPRRTGSVGSVARGPRWPGVDSRHWGTSLSSPEGQRRRWGWNERQRWRLLWCRTQGRGSQWFKKARKGGYSEIRSKERGYSD